MCELKDRELPPPSEGGVSSCTKKKYYCQMDYPLGLEKHVFGRLWLGNAHIFGLIGAGLYLSGSVPAGIMLIVFPYAYFSGTGTTMGAHRLWAHKTYKANLALRLILTYAQTTGVQYPIFRWCQIHRLHHKYVETDADPHNAKRGFFFAHMGWLITPEHPEVKAKEDTIDMSDLDADPIIRFQTKFYWILAVICVQLVPGAILSYFYPELSYFQLYCLNCMWYVLTLHATWSVNSAAHFYGDKPYDTSHAATENPFVSVIAIGEGHHNYHHVFPWDYKTSEFGNYWGNNVSAMLIDFFAKLGWATDLKTVPSSVVTQRILRTGDHHAHIKKFGDSGRFKGEEGKFEKETKEPLPAWGWGDEAIPEEYKKITQCLKPSKAA